MLGSAAPHPMTQTSRRSLRTLSISGVTLCSALGVHASKAEVDSRDGPASGFPACVSAQPGCTGRLTSTSKRQRMSPLGRDENSDGAIVGGSHSRASRFLSGSRRTRRPADRVTWLLSRRRMSAQFMSCKSSLAYALKVLLPCKPAQDASFDRLMSLRR
jgi:hypothetical protein